MAKSNDQLYKNRALFVDWCGIFAWIVAILLLLSIWGVIVGVAMLFVLAALGVGDG